MTERFRPSGLKPDAPKRSYARSVSVLLLMSPELRDRIDAAATAAGRRRLPFLLDLIDRALPTTEDQEGARMAS